MTVERGAPDRLEESRVRPGLMSHVHSSSAIHSEKIPYDIILYHFDQFPGKQGPHMN